MVPVLVTVETPRAVSSQTPSTPPGFGLGATTHGWRPISVKIQPNEDARNGGASAAMPSRPTHTLPVTRPLRVTQNATRASAADPSANPIIRRKPQYVTAR